MHVREKINIKGFDKRKCEKEMINNLMIKIWCEGRRILKRNLQQILHLHGY